MQLEGISEHMDMITTTVTAAAMASRPISDEEEYYVGRSVAARILSTYPMHRNKKLTDYINAVGQTVAMHSDKPFTYNGYHFAILDSLEINAFASPGGTIFITMGMLRSLRNEDELAAVLAHEVAHINHRDGISAIKKARWTEALTVIGSAAAKGYASQDLAKLVTLFEGSIDDVFKTLVVNGYGQVQELGADKTALMFLDRAGYDPLALRDFIARLITQGKSSEGGLLKTHPATTDRLDNVIKNMPSWKTDNFLVKKRTARFTASIK